MEYIVLIYENRIRTFIECKSVKEAHKIAKIYAKRGFDVTIAKTEYIDAYMPNCLTSVNELL